MVIFKKKKEDGKTLNVFGSYMVFHCLEFPLLTATTIAKPADKRKFASINTVIEMGTERHCLCACPGEL